MRKPIPVTKFLILILLGLLPYQAHAQQILNTSNNPIKEADFAPDHFIVKYKNNTLAPLDATTAASADQGDEVPIKHFKGTKSIDQLHQKHHIKGMRKAFRKHKRGPLTAKQTAIVDDFEKQDVYLLNLNTKDKNAIKQAVVDFQHDPNVEYAQPDFIVTANFTPNDPYFQSKGSWGQTYDDLWGIKRINAPQAWDITKGAGIVVAVVDSGLDYNHPDIATNLWTNFNEKSVNGSDDDGNGYVDDLNGWNFVNNTNNPMDDNGHGTHVAGTIAAIGNNNLGVVGVAPEAKIMPLKVLNSAGNGLTSDEATAIVYAAKNGAKVINLSMGCLSYCPSNPILEDAVRFADDSGSVVVNSAGNNSQANAAYTSPQNMLDHKPLVVASSDADNSRSYFNTMGNTVDITAPGGGLWINNVYERGILSLKAAQCSALTCPSTLIVGSNYLRQAGTSMAAPHVSGVAALAFASHPNFTNQDVKNAIKYTANPMDGSLPGGLIDAAKLTQLQNLPIAQIKSPTDSSMIMPNSTSIPIIGNAGAIKNFSTYNLSYAVYSLNVDLNTLPWNIITNSNMPVNNGTLGIWNTSGLKPGVYLLRLQSFIPESSVPLTTTIAVSVADPTVTTLFAYPNRFIKVVDSAVKGNIAAWITTDTRDPLSGFYNTAYYFNFSTGKSTLITTKNAPLKVYLTDKSIIILEQSIYINDIEIFDFNAVRTTSFSISDYALPFYQSLVKINNQKIFIQYKDFFGTTPPATYYYDLLTKQKVFINNLAFFDGEAALNDSDDLYFLTTNSNNVQILNSYNLNGGQLKTFGSVSNNSIIRDALKGQLSTSVIIDNGGNMLYLYDTSTSPMTNSNVFPTKFYPSPVISLMGTSSSKLAWVYSSKIGDHIRTYDVQKRNLDDTPVGAAVSLKSSLAMDDQHLLWADKDGIFSFPFPQPPIIQVIPTQNVIAGSTLNVQVKATDVRNSKIFLNVSGTGPTDLASYMPGAVFKDNGDGTGNLTWAMPANLPSKVYNLNLTATNAFGLSSTILITVKLTASLIGNIDAVTANTDGSYAVSGWACSTGQDASIGVKLKLGGVSLNVEYLAASGTANLGSDSIIKNACMATGNNYRFSLTMNATDVKNYSGLPLKVYGISAINGSEAAISNPSGFTVPGVRDTQPPSAPSNVMAKVTSPGSINLTWTASTDNIKVERYLIYRNNQLIYISTATSLNDIGLVPNTSYTYSVTAMDTAGNSSIPSNTVTAITFNCCSTGDITYWDLDGSLNIADRGYFPKGQGLAGWRLAATVDLNGDGKKDLIWQNTSTGGIVYWYMNGINFISGDYFPQGQQSGLVSWRLVTAADLNGDGKPDLVWQNTSTGGIVYWYMNGINFISGDYFPQGQQSGLVSWRLVTAADLNGDGKPDLVWQNTSTGDIAYWYMNGINLISGDYFPQGHQNGGLANWRLVTAADLNGDGKADLVWQVISSGDIAYWYMNGINLVSNGFFPQGQQGGGLAPWNLAAMTDLNGDGKPDIVWQYK